MLQPHPHKTFMYHDLFVAWDGSERKHFLPWQVRCSQCREVFYYSLPQTPLTVTGIYLYVLPACVSVWLITVGPTRGGFNGLESHTNNLLTFFVFFGQGGDSDLSLISSELLLPLTPSVTGECLIWSDLYLTLHAALEQRALNFIMTWLKIKRFTLLHFSNEKEHCMYSFKMFFLPILPVIHIHIRNYRKGLINNK